ncbi:unnamed protein product [Litomosoides sigmodontis]|uniref:Uncharacterized protein n=1 Tax=Litomosoides sigmodontis TaxID=42156 RepID=A0A3P6S6Z1_LITSI|nr:unnamed protein product [Litomosoides sigmodontis]
MLPSSLHFTSRQDDSCHGNFRKTGIDSRMSSGSLLSLRTFYAFGARNGRILCTQKSLSCNARGNSLCARSSQQLKERCDSFQRASTTSSTRSLKHHITYRHRQYFTPSLNVSKPYLSAAKWNRRENCRLEVEKLTLSKISRNTGISTMQAISDSEPFRINAHCSNHTENDTELQHSKEPVHVTPVQAISNEMPKTPEDSAEVIALIERNKLLEEEMKRLTLKLREKEQSEKECKRKILEYAAEIKVWKKKYEMQKLKATVEISESKDNEEEISDIMEQLNNAAEKLTRLDAVKDLKLLQNEMETALREISN